MDVDPSALASRIPWTGGQKALVGLRETAGRYVTEGWVDHIDLDDVTSGLDAMAAGTALKLLVDIDSARAGMRT
jgi:hypothetical protein